MADAHATTQLDLAPPKTWRRFIPGWLRSLIWVDSAPHYDAFLSYSWQADSKTAPAIHSVLQRFLCPWYKLRAKTVFRDLSCMPAGSSLQRELFDRMDRSTHLVVLASPWAAHSGGMEMEALHWFGQPRNGEVLVIVTDGDYKTWDQIRDNLLPPTVREKLVTEPLWIPLQHRRPSILADPDTQTLRAQLIEDLKQVLLRFYAPRTWEELQGQERAQRRRALGMMSAATLLFLGLAVAAVAFARRAQTETAVAEQNARDSRARELAAYATGSLNDDPERSIILAMYALSTAPTGDDLVRSEAEQLLRRALLTCRVGLTISGHQGSVGHLAFSPDGKRLVTGDDKTWAIWDAFSGKRLVVESSGQIVGLALSGDGRLLATGSQYEHTVKLWDTSTAQLLRTLQGHSSIVQALAFSSDGKLLATGSGEAMIWEVASGKALFRLPCEEQYGSINSVAFNRDASLVAVSCNGHEAKLWDVRSAHLVRNISDQTMGVAFSPGGHLATTNYGRVARLWDLSGNLLREFRGHEGDLTAIAFSPDGELLATGSQDNTVKIWSVSDGQRPLITLTGHSEQITAVAFSPDGSRLATASTDKTARIWSIVSDGLREFPSLIGASGALYDVAYSHDGAQMATVGENSTVQIWDAATGDELCKFTVSGPLAVSYSPKRHFLVVGTAKGNAELWDTDSRRLLRSISAHDMPVNAVAFLPDGTQFVTASSDGSAKFWDIESGQEKLRLGEARPEPDQQTDPFDRQKGVGILALAISPDGRRIITGTQGGFDQDSVANVWDAVSGKKQLTISVGRPVGGAAFSADGRLMATIDEDRTVAIWDAISGSRIKAFPQHFEPGGAVSFGQRLGIAFSPDSRRLAAASWSRTARVWDAASGELLDTLSGHTKQVTGLAFSSDGKRLAVAGGDGTVRVYATTAEGLLALARSRVTRMLAPEECKTYLHAEKCPSLP